MNSLNLSTINISGFNLIEASAGTGKTWTIAALYILLLLEKELRPEEILVVTYTKAATAELRERIRRRITTTLDLFASGREANDDDLERMLLTDRRQNNVRCVKLLTRALYSFDDAAIYTIHGFCQRALVENSFESGSLFGSEMVSDQSAIVKQVCHDFWRTHILSQSDAFVERLISEGHTPEKLAKPFVGHFQDPDLIVIPTAEEVPTASLKAERDWLFTQISGHWILDRSAIIQQLERAHLNQHSYKTSQIESAALIFDSWTTWGNASLPNSKLDFFSLQKITSKKTKATIISPDHPFFSRCQELVGVLNSLDHAYKSKLHSCQRDLKQWLEVELGRRKKRLNQRSFDDLLLDLHCALESDAGVQLADKLRLRYKAALIDEFQDTDPLQWNIFRHMGAAPDYPLFLIGDPKQAIYSFRGADIFAYLTAGKCVPQENMHTLGTNFRSDDQLVQAVATLFSAVADPFDCQDIPFHPVVSGRSELDCLLVDGYRDRQPFKFWVYPRGNETKPEVKHVATRAIVQAAADEIAALLAPNRSVIVTSGISRQLMAGDIAVLVKTHRQAEQVQDALSKLQIPSVQQGSSTIFESAEALDLLRILRAVAEPHREALVREALLTTSVGLSANEIAAFVESSGEHPEWEAWLLRFRNLHVTAASGGVVALVSLLLGSYGVRRRILSLFGGERCLTNILHCCELLHQIEREQGNSLQSLITWLERKICFPGKDDAALLRLESDENAVMIATIHASKGLQYPVVFVPFAWDGPSGKSDRALFHDDEGALVLDLAAEVGNLHRAAAEQKAEAARLLYVALTRAEFRCYAVWGCISGAGESPLFNLLHGSPESAHLGAKFSAISDRTIYDDVCRLAGNGDNGINTTMMSLTSPCADYHPDEATNMPYISRSLGIPLRDDWYVASFSSMTSGSGHLFEPHDRDTTAEPIMIDSPATQSEPEATSGKLTIFDFPRGAKAGTCLHDIFEHLDYARLDRSDITTLCGSSLARSGFDEQWLPAVSNMVHDVVSAPIIPDKPDFSLSRLKTGQWQPEMEFYLPVRHLAPETIHSLFEGLLDGEQFKDFYGVLHRLSFRQSRGMLQGFIDLVFTHDGRYYIVDWKSNHLGLKASEYHREAMHESMCRSAYILQYHLYTLALDRLLKLHLPDYDYERNFGGVIYLYLRGVSAGVSPNGIYFDRPLAEFIQRADGVMLD